MNKLLSTNKKNFDIGILIIRIGVGTMFIVHGAPKIFGGPDYWKMIGEAMANLGIHFAPVIWGFMAGFSEFFGGICLILGLFTTPACFFLISTMMVASTTHFANGEGINGASHAIEAAVLFFGIIFTGPGKYSLDHQFFR